MGNTKAKYRVWMAIPVEVEAYDDINAEDEAERAYTVDYTASMTDANRKRLRGMHRVLPNDTEIYEDKKWRRV